MATNSPTIHFDDMNLASGPDSEDAVDFLIRNRFPYDRVVNPTEEQARAQIASTLASGDDRRTFWIEDGELGRVGLIQLRELASRRNSPEFDMRIDGPKRGKGLGLRALRAFVAFFFEQYPDVNRLQGRLREDNRAIRQILAQAGFLKEGHLREAWPVDGEDPRDEIIYGLLRRDWETGTATPVIWDDIGL